VQPAPRAVPPRAQVITGARQVLGRSEGLACRSGQSSVGGPPSEPAEGRARGDNRSDTGPSGSSEPHRAGINRGTPVLGAESSQASCVMFDLKLPIRVHPPDRLPPCIRCAVFSVFRLPPVYCAAPRSARLNPRQSDCEDPLFSLSIHCPKAHPSHLFLRPPSSRPSRLRNR
jgi:hypothetical protein